MAKVGLVVCLLFFVFINYASAADVSITPSSGSYSVGQTFTATIKALPAGDSINAVEATIGFDSTVLQVVSVSKTGSAFSLWTTEPTFSNSAGTITFGGGSPTPFSANSNLLSVTFRTLSAGQGTVSFNTASVLAADGLGTNVLDNKINATYTVSGAAVPEPEPEPVSQPEPTTSKPEDNDATIAFGDPPRAPEVGSQAFLDPEIWYNVTDGIFTWTLPFDVNVVAVEVATSSENQPEENEDAIYDPPIEEFVLSSENVKDGIQYLSIKFKNQVGWGTVLNRKVMIDTTPPEKFPINVVAANKTNAFPRLTFEATDKTSGIAKYVMFVADREPFEITPDEARVGYLLSDLIDGTYTVKVVAYDMAGNTIESSVAVLIMAGWTPPVEEEEKWSFWSLFTGTNLLFLFLFVVVLLQGIYIWFERKKHREKEEKLRRETREVQDQMEKIFSALRDEIYDQINTITKRKRLSKKEKEAVEGLNQALEVSETLIEKEINDVKSILK
ncbi:hypothetical protein KC723_01480 [Candidatus Kaiserbacteria bacterium]|nr:hypothetical protein [Candidatus Kaiserbacteria bacterium]